ncbi:hypothetical protein ScPMuIL_001056 [Solemya velum]
MAAPIRFATGVLRTVFRAVTSPLQRGVLPPVRTDIPPSQSQCRHYTSNLSLGCTRNLLSVCSPFKQCSRNVVRYSVRKGKPKSSKAVVKRFFRLYWGGWIRPRVGREKKLWTKTRPRRYRLRQHVFCNSQQSKLLDRMVTPFWKREHYYVDDPYAPYHKRTNSSHFLPEKPRFFP